MPQACLEALLFVADTARALTVNHSRISLQGVPRSVHVHGLIHNKWFLLFHYCAINNIRAKERAKYATLLHCRTGQKNRLKEESQNGQTKLYFIN